MNRFSVFEAGLARFDRDQITVLSEPCRPRVLIVVDGALNFNDDDSLGLWRFLYSITVGSGVTNKPIITLAHRGDHPKTNTITVEDDKYTVKEFFDFTTVECPVVIDNYDQIWLFGKLEEDSGLSPAEIDVISKFMNSGGGVFATGDHARMGRKLCSALPRIRHMRDWKDTPMGTEPELDKAVNRIDTVVNPGDKNLFELEDQYDNIPQRIYPNYTVTARVGGGWQATVSPLLMLPDAPEIRINASGFVLDIDVLPDHPHESVCQAVTDKTEVGCIKVLEGKYPNKVEPKFDEFPPVAINPAKRVGVEIVAFAVSGGRSVFNNAWKPPVRPQMFGVISAYDGHQAQPYEVGGPPPGCIVCDSTWHHFINLNLDGTGTSRQGLGVWSGGEPGKGTFTPSPALENIFFYYRNTIKWLQPANRKVCSLWWTLIALRYHPLLIEELLDAPRLTTWRDFAGLGIEATRLTNLAIGSQALPEMAARVLISDGSQRAVDLVRLLNNAEVQQTYLDPNILLNGVLGGLLAKVAVILPEDDLKAAIRVLEDGHEKWVLELRAEIIRLLRLGIDEHNARVKETTGIVNEIDDLLKSQ